MRGVDASDRHRPTMVGRPAAGWSRQLLIGKQANGVVKSEQKYKDARLKYQKFTV